MDLTEIESKLHALDKLYDLLLNNYDDTCHSSSNKLDDGARYMLKHLLDMETERVIKAQSEITRSEGVDSSCSSQQLKDNTKNQKFHPGEVPFQAPIGDQEDLATDLISSPSEKQGICGHESPAKTVSQSNMIFTGTEFDNRKKRCRICQRVQSKPSSILSDSPKTVSDLNPAGFIIENEEHSKRVSDDDTNVSGSNKQNLSSQGGQNDSSSTGISESSYSNNAPEARDYKNGKKPFSKEDAHFVSVEASAAVGKIQSHITALKLDAESLLPPRKRAAQFGLHGMSTDLMASVPTQTTTGKIESQQKSGENSGQADRMQTLPKVVPTPAMRTSNVIESLCNQIVSVDRLPSQNRGVRGFGFQEQEAKKSNWHLILSARAINQMNKEDRDNQVRRSNKGARQTVFDHTSHTVHPSRIPSRRPHFPLESSSLSPAEHEPSEPSVFSLHDNSLDRHRIRFLKNKNNIRRRKRTESMDHRALGSTDSDYSTGTNQSSSDSSNEINLNSGVAEIHISGTPSSRSESDAVCSLPRRTRHLPASSTSSSETEVYSSASRSDSEIYSSTSSIESWQDTATSSNERHRYTSYARPGSKHDQEQSYSSDDSASSRSGRVHTKPSRDRKKRGVLKKLKDKLAIVFHHHHHHHHHQTDKKDQNNPAGAKKRNGKSLWKRSRKVINLEREKEIKSEQAVKKVGNSIIRGGARKNKHGHFYELMKGLMRHKRRSKQSKQSLIYHERKKATKKSPWWKRLPKQKGSKAHKRAHTKIR